MGLGAAGEMIGHVLDHNGQALDSPLAQRVTSLRLPMSAAQPVIGFGGGKAKYTALNAALRGRALSGLVTDEPAHGKRWRRRNKQQRKASR